MRFHRTALASVVAPLLVLATAAGASPAVASAPGPSVPAGAVRVDMRVAGFDAEVAAANGYVIKTAPDGRSIP